MKRIHCLNNISHYGTDLLPEDYQLTDTLDESTAILVRSAAMHDMQFPESLLAIARAGAGVNNIPLERCAEEGIVVFNTPGANANAVKELVLCGLLLGSREIVDGIAWCRQNADDENISKSVEKAKKAYAGKEIEGKTLGVIGLGAIGAKVANAALALGMDVIGYDPYLSVNAALRLKPAVRVTDNCYDVYQEADYLTIHVPAVEETIGMVDTNAFGAMNDGMVLLNFSRDTLVEGGALATALESGKLACYITDFATPAVMKMPNTIVLPHLGASTAEAEDNCAIMAVEELMNYIENGNIVNSVNYPALTKGVCPDGMHRVAVLYSSESGVEDQAIELLEKAAQGLDCMSAQRGGTSYLLADTQNEIDAETLTALSELAGVYRVRSIA